jgi:PqqD family protein of HPr-rel-A system
MTGLKTLQISNDGFAFDSSTGETYTLNRSGRLVLQKLQQGENRAQIATKLSDQFGIAQSLAERDVADFWQQMESLGLAPKSKGVMS